MICTAGKERHLLEATEKRVMHEDSRRGWRKIKRDSPKFGKREISTAGAEVSVSGGGESDLRRRTANHEVTRRNTRTFCKNPQIAGFLGCEGYEDGRLERQDHFLLERTMKILTIVLLLAALAFAAGDAPPQTRTFEVKFKVFLKEEGEYKYVGTAGTRFSIGPGDPKPPGVSQKGSVVDFDDRIRTEFFLGEVVEKQK